VKVLRQLVLTGIVSVTFAGVASATPITYELVSLVQTGTGNAALGVTTLTAHTPGTGDITVLGGEIVSGTGSGADWTMNISVALLGVEVDVVTTDQDISAISSAGGAVTANGLSANTTCGGSGAAFLCGSVLVGPNLPWTWPTPDDGFGNPETATIANFVGNDTSFSFDMILYSNNDLGANGTVEVTQTWHFASVPEPGTVMLLGTGLLGLLVTGRRRA